MQKNTKMKIYEIGQPCKEGKVVYGGRTLWIAVPEGINVEDVYSDENGYYCKYLKEYDENTPGVDFIFRMAS